MLSRDKFEFCLRWREHGAKHTREVIPWCTSTWQAFSKRKRFQAHIDMAAKHPSTKQQQLQPSSLSRAVCAEEPADQIKIASRNSLRVPFLSHRPVCTKTIDTRQGEEELERYAKHRVRAALPAEAGCWRTELRATLLLPSCRKKTTGGRDGYIGVYAKIPRRPPLSRAESTHPPPTQSRGGRGATSPCPRRGRLLAGVKLAMASKATAASARSAFESRTTAKVCVC